MYKINFTIYLATIYFFFYITTYLTFFPEKVTQFIHTTYNNLSLYMIELSEVDSLVQKFTPTKSTKKLKTKIQNNMYILEPKDQIRFFDCLDDKVTPWPRPYKDLHHLKLFTSSTSSKEVNGLMLVNKEWPLLISIHNHTQYNQNRKIFIGFRGMEWGIHKTPFTPYILKFIREKFTNDILLLPDSYIFTKQNKINIKKDKIMAVCHARRYPWLGRISQYWPGFDNDGAWEMVNTFFPKNKNIYLLGWSNGSFPRSQFIETKQKKKSLHVNFNKQNKDLHAFEKSFSKNHKFINKDIKRIKVIADIETNYSSKKPLWNLIKYMRKYIVGNKNKLYYGTCSLSMSPVKNYIKIIKLFNLKGIELKNGVIRYTNTDNNIIIDIIPANKYRAVYVTRFGNLNKTRFEKYKKSIKKRLTRSHKQIVIYTFNELHKYMRRVQWL